MPSYRDQSIDLQLDSLACVRDKSVGTPRRPFKGWRLYLAKSTIRFAEQLSAVERYVAHWNRNKWITGWTSKMTSFRPSVNAKDVANYYHRAPQSNHFPFSCNGLLCCLSTVLCNPLRIKCNNVANETLSRNLANITYNLSRIAWNAWIVCDCYGCLIWFAVTVAVKGVSDRVSFQRW